jgi:hypothetical protein
MYCLLQPMVALVLFPWLILFVILIDTAIARKCLMQQIPAEYWKQKQAGGESCEMLLQAWFCCSELPFLELVRVSTCRLHVQSGKRSSECCSPSDGTALDTNGLCTTVATTNSVISDRHLFRSMCSRCTVLCRFLLCLNDTVRSSQPA